MQTFLPVPSFTATAKILDKKRLFKQLVESRQILACLGVNVKKNDGTPFKAGWKNHPCCKMWKGYEIALMKYHNDILVECIERGIKTKIKPFLISISSVRLPPFIGNKKFHDSHKSNLLRKKKEYYNKYMWSVPDNIEYVWEI